jgi:hypothetical protein
VAPGATYRKKGRAGVDRFHALHHCDRMIGKVRSRQVIARIGERGRGFLFLEEDGLELARVPGVEAVEIVESEARWASDRKDRLRSFPTPGVLWFLPIQAVA